MAPDYIHDLWQHGAEGLHVVDGNGIILDANPADYEPLGYAREEYVGHHIAEFHADQETIGDILRRLSAGEEIRDYEATLRCKDGSIRVVSITSNVRFIDGKFAHTRCFTHDITEAAELRAQLREANEELRRIVVQLRQRDQAIRDLSTPVVQLAERVLLCPVVGTLDSARMGQLMESVLGAISEYQASVVILDLSGVPIVDTAVANAVLNTVQAASLLGARCVITGLRAPVAQTMVELGIDMSAVTTRSTLRAGLQTAMSMAKAVSG